MCVAKKRKRARGWVDVAEVQGERKEAQDTGYGPSKKSDVIRRHPLSAAPAPGSSLNFLLVGRRRHVWWRGWGVNY